jgi:hypothetical protein
MIEGNGQYITNWEYRIESLRERTITRKKVVTNQKHIYQPAF